MKDTDKNFKEMSRQLGEKAQEIKKLKDTHLKLKQEVEEEREKSKNTKEKVKKEFSEFKR